jgi:hypothetical protein
MRRLSFVVVRAGLVPTPPRVALSRAEKNMDARHKGRA